MSTASQSGGTEAGTLRALWLVRDNLQRHPGGDTTQILQTAAALRRRGVVVELRSVPPADARDYHLLHVFHLDRLWEHLPVCRNLRRPGLPVVLSPIYWPTDEYDRRGRVGWQGLLARTFGSAGFQTLRLLQRFALACWQGRSLRGFDLRLLDFRRAARRLLECASVLLPNSAAELREIERHFGIRRPAVIVPNAVDAETFGLADADAAEGSRRGVLCVGRVEPRKNQLSLLRALRGSGIPLTLAGGPGRFHAAYARRCLKLAGPDVHFVGQRSPLELRELYRHARVHACVSWYETPGLASLEAAAAGCNLVVTPGGCTREYFGDEAWYCEPDDPASIREAVEAALAAGPRPELARRVARQFNWDAAADATLAGYRLALEGERSSACFVQRPAEPEHAAQGGG